MTIIILGIPEIKIYEDGKGERVSGFCSDMTAAVSSSVFAPADFRPIWWASRLNPPMIAARTTDGLAPTSSV